MLYLPLNYQYHITHQDLSHLILLDHYLSAYPRIGTEKKSTTKLAASINSFIIATLTWTSTPSTTLHSALCDNDVLEIDVN